MKTGIGQSKYRNLTLFHVVWSVPAKVFLTVTFSIWSILTHHDLFGSDAEQDRSYTVFAVVFFYLNQEPITCLNQTFKKYRWIFAFSCEPGTGKPHSSGGTAVFPKNFHRNKPFLLNSHRNYGFSIQMVSAERTLSSQPPARFLHHFDWRKSLYITIAGKG